MFVTTKGYVSEFQLADYLNYANKQKEIKIVDIGSKNLYQLYLETSSKSKSTSLVTNHKSSVDTLLSSYGQETLVSIKGKQVRRLQLDINQVNYKELQDQLLGDFVFVHKATNQLVIVDNIDYNEKQPNELSSKYIQKKLLKLKRRNYLYKALAGKIIGKGSHYLSVVWNSNSDDDLLDFLDNANLQNKYLRHTYNKQKANGFNVSGILTQIHVKTNIDLDKLSFDVTKNIY